jgi:hypothetical protein
MGPVLFGRFCSVGFLGSRQLSGAGPESQHLVGCAAGWNGAVRDDNAIGTGSIPKMAGLVAGLAGLDTSGRTGTWNGDTNGHKHEVVKEAAMDSRFLPPACVVLLCGVQIAQMRD